MTTPRLPRLALLAALLLTSPLLAPACSRQAEGDRCDRNSGDSDCEDGLVCTNIGASIALCCPPQGQTVNVPACIPGLVNTTGGSGGSSGSSGQSGTSGQSGAAGEAGSAGASGEAGTAGAAGEAGASGVAGSAGEAGQGG
ncbi:MAG: hypothetical protein MUF64_19270 [Polyangiaceae bacterium]|nr:hypothetical protein [Polyangiaceae bacterium]